jgi:arylsulfatase A-like enzyme
MSRNRIAVVSRIAPGIALGTALALEVLALPRVATAAGRRPNILFIIMDDVGIDQMRVFGYDQDNQPQTPNIDTVARAGVRFRNTWAMPECSPSRVAFFTGRYPMRTGVMNAFINTDLANSQMSPYETTAPRVLARARYQSALLGKYHLAGPYNYPSGDYAPHDAGFNYFYGNLEGAPRPLDTTAGGVAPDGTYTCGYVNDARFGECRFADGHCTQIGDPTDAPSATPGRSCLEQGGILVPNLSCDASSSVQPNFATYNGYYVSPLVIIREDGSMEEVPSTDPRARRYLTIDQTDAAIDWITKAQQSGTPWMATVSYSSAHLPAQQAPESLVPSQPPATGELDCTRVPAQRILQNHMTEAMDEEIGRLLVSTGLASRDPDGNLRYDPAATDTMIVIVGDNGTYGLSVKYPFDPTRAKGFAYQTGVWVPLIVAGPLVDEGNVGGQLDAMVNAVDLFRLFAEIAGVKVEKVVPKTHTLDAQKMLPYLTKPHHTEIRKSNFTQMGQNLHASGTVLWPCVIDAVKTCVQLFTFEGLCNAEGGTWYGPGGAGGPDGIATCCDVNSVTGQDYSIYPNAQWAMRNDQYKLVVTQALNCANNQTDLQYAFYQIDDASPMPALDREQTNLLSSPYLPPQGLDATQLDTFNDLYSRLDKMLASEPECTGDGNLDKRVNQTDLDDWGTLDGLGSSVYDLNLDGQTDDADTMIIRQNYGRRCPVTRSPK